MRNSNTTTFVYPPPSPRLPNELCPAVMEAFVDCDELLAREPRMVVTELENPCDGKRYEVGGSSQFGTLCRRYVLYVCAKEVPLHTQSVFQVVLDS